MLDCLKNPHSNDTRHALMTFQYVYVLFTDFVTFIDGVMSTWVFNQDYIRRALVEMIIIDELPFRFVEGQGFRRFGQVACPRSKIPSR